MPEVSGQAFSSDAQMDRGEVMQPYSPYDQLDPAVVANAVAWLEALGYDLQSEHTRMTPYRLSWYVRQVLENRIEDVHVTSFANEDPEVKDMVVVPRIPIWSACAHHLLPFFGHVDFGYIPGQRLLGLSKIPQLIQRMAKGPWLQEHLAHAIADKFYQDLEADGVIVRVECQHTCVMLDLGWGDVPSMVTCALRGDFQDCPECVAEFMEHLK